MRRLWLVLALVILAAPPLAAQRWRGFFSYIPDPLPYDGQFTIVRLWYAGHPGWSYDYPDMEQNLGRLLPEITAIRINQKGSNILRMDDPELMKYPIAYLSEPGYWYPNEAEALGLRTYLAKGGFLIVDDFHFPREWAVFEQAMRQVLPDALIERLTLAHPVFNAFFQIRSLDVPYPGELGEQGLMGEFYGIHENNDPSRRLSVVINYNMDIGNYMEHSAEGRFPVDPTNEAFKFGMNYLIYAFTH
jgi:hypothetical protein